MTYSRRFFGTTRPAPVPVEDRRTVLDLDGAPGTDDTTPALVVTAPEDVTCSWLVDVRGHEYAETTVGVGDTKADALNDARQTLARLAALLDRA